VTVTAGQKAEWKAARRARRALERRLPERLARLVGVVRRDDLGDAFASTVLRDAADVARVRRGERRVVEVGNPNWSYILPVVERDVLRQLDDNDAYRNHVRRDVRRVLRSEHLVRVDPGAERITLPERLGPLPKAAGGILEVESDIGLGTATVLESEPEQWNVWVASEIRRTWTPGALNDSCRSRVLVIGALAGGFARTVNALDARMPEMIVSEADWVFSSPTNLPCVEGRGTIGDSGEMFHNAVVVLPAPALSEASTQRGIYPEASPDDPARLGAARWQKAVAEVVEVVSAFMAPSARAYVLVPAGVRSRRGYIEAPELPDAVVDAAVRVGLVAERRLETIEIAPVRQPFVGTRRPRKATFVLRKGAL
jgi:hypothetical protein